MSITGSGLATGQQAMSASAPVAIASDQAAFPVTAAATLAAETTKVIGTVNIASGQTIASTEADGANITLGAKADAKNTATDTTAVSVVSVLKQISASCQAPPSSAVTNAGTFAVQATLAAETTKVIGTVNIAAGQTIASTEADGANITLGAKADAKNAATDTTAVSAISVLKQISASVQAPPSTPVTNTGTFAVQAAAPTLTKGTQGSTGYSVQDLKDSGRKSIIFYATAVASGLTTVETAITLTKSAGTAATTSAVSFVITSGKTFRITNMTFASRGNAVAVAQSTTFNLRLNTGGAVTTSSTPILLSVVSATPATANAFDRVDLDIPDGYEIVGDGTIQFGLTAAATFVTSAPTWDVTIIGFEY